MAASTASTPAKMSTAPLRHEFEGTKMAMQQAMKTALPQSGTYTEQAVYAGMHRHEVTECSVEELVARARQREPDAWVVMLKRYDSLVRSITRKYGLSFVDADDIRQMVWLKVFERISELRQPGALPGWIGAITANMCKREVRSLNRTIPTDPSAVAVAWSLANLSRDGAVDDVILREESWQAVRRGLAELSPHEQQLLLLLAGDPPASYAQVSHQLGIPQGSIGPSRARYLRKLRQTEALRSWFDLASAQTDQVA